jgi:hypothetical protein
MRWLCFFLLVQRSQSLDLSTSEIARIPVRVSFLTTCISVSTRALCTKIVNSLFMRSSSTAGGAIFMETGGRMLVVNDSTFCETRADVRGGAIAHGGTALIYIKTVLDRHHVVVLARRWISGRTRD